MAAPIALSAIFDLLPIASVEWDIERSDEFSGVGSGDLWQAEVADPFWAANVTLGRGLNDELKRAAARIRRLDGARQSFMLCDPISLYPQADPTGTIIGSANVTVRAVASDRNIAQLQGFPNGYTLTVGDKLQFTQGAMQRFFEVSASAVAAAGGNMDVTVFPRLPLALAAGAVINLKKPACPVIIQPKSHKPGVARRSVTEGAGFRVLQKKRG